MGWVTGIVVYILVWWITLFTVLPLWVRPADPDDPGHVSGAPRDPHMLRKVLLTSAVAAVIWLAIFVVVSEPWFSFRES